MNFEISSISPNCPLLSFYIAKKLAKTLIFRIFFKYALTFPGLLGPLVICKKGTLGSNGLPKGYDAEKFILMAVMDENKSWQLDKNMNKYCKVQRCNNISKGLLMPLILIRNFCHISQRCQV